MFCPKCGKEAPEGSSFCPSCGASLAGDAPSAKEEFASGEPAPAKKRRSKGLLVIALVVVVLIAAGGAVAVNVLTAPEKEPPHAAEQADSGTEGASAGVSDSAAGQDDADDSAPAEDLEVSDVTITEEKGIGQCVKLTVTNNTDEVLCTVPFTATGDFDVVDEYGDKETSERDLALVCLRPYYDFFITPAIGYLMPGENEVVLAPMGDKDVASYYGRNDSSSDIYADNGQHFGLDDVSNLEVTVDAEKAERLPAGQRILMPDECDVSLEIAPDGTLKGTVTNESDIRWDSVEVFFYAEDSDGVPVDYRESADMAGSEYLWYGKGSGTAEFVDIGATAELEISHRIPDEAVHLEPVYVLVTEGV